MSRSRKNRSLRSIFKQQLHEVYQPHQFDNWLVWAGNHSILIDDIRYRATLGRAYLGPPQPAVRARVRVELFVAAVDPRQVRPGDVDVRLWTDANARGFVDPQGIYQDDPGRYLPMHLRCTADQPELIDNNLVFESEEFALDTTGVFNYTVEFSADDPGKTTDARQWVSLNDLADNRNGVIVVSPTWAQECPTIAEICARKVGAAIDRGQFQSGTLQAVTALLDQIPAEVIYLLPFFKPGFGDLHSGEDVRKGTLGSPYAVQDFFQLDPELVTPPERADLGQLVRDQLLGDADAVAVGLRQASDLEKLSPEVALSRIDRQSLVQLIGRAELRQLTRRAHNLGKKVIFDLVLMQTSRDSPLIEEHPDWYVLDEQGVPRIHQIAWLVYSDVALFDLVFNQSLQNYLSGVAPYWIEQCDLDGVRIDASQTIDRPFLKKIKNRITAMRPDALVLGETLCALEQAVDIPADMIYALLVDFHRDLEQATPLIDFLEEMHRRFAPRTIAMAYFENHDSPRATEVWRARYAQLLADSAAARAWWQDRGGELQMALLKNLQASLIDLSAGSHDGSNLTCGLELGSWWGETTRTDFEHETRLDFDLRNHPPHAYLTAAYQRLFECHRQWTALRYGQVYYQRNQFPGGDPADRVFGYVRYTAEQALLILHNFDPVANRQATYTFDFLAWQKIQLQTLFDTYTALQIPTPAATSSNGTAGFTFRLHPLQSQVLQLCRK